MKAIKKESKGRPAIQYSLAVDKKKIISELKEDINSKLKKLYNILNKLDSLEV